ncbi:hypothetical protein AAKU52_002051 [Pedobacter sp. CG_S7]|uniref:hypothetical protein n=1 Tax=Pedobacter sp. CG_S7 TaxID=3143930 RepID=UPI003393BBFF
MVNKVCLIVLFPILILNTYLIEVFKIPNLVSHFIQHKALDNRVDVIDFIVMHYIGDEIIDSDYKEDMELPFKKIEVHSIIPFAIPVHHTVLEKVQFSILAAIKINPKVPEHYNPSKGCLFKPPRA